MSHTLGRWILVLSCALTAFSCGTDEPETGEEVESLTVATGVDYSWARPSPSSLHAAGYTFAARYLSYVPSKNLSVAEKNALWGAGVDVVVVWEETAQAALNGFARGQSDAAAANQQANALGIPAGRPIYFAVDFDGQGNQQAAINAYFDGVASVIGRDRTGAYAGYYVINRLFNAGKIAWGWQTYAWSYGNWDPRAQVRQVHNGISVGNSINCCDRDQAVASDYGQWHGQMVGSDGCTALEDHDAGVFGCTCVNHHANGGYCDGTGCTAVETHNAGQFGCACVDHQPNGGYCPGTGCTARETINASHFGCQCVDHQPNGGFCPGTGCTALETHNAAQFGCQCVDHQPNGGFCPGTGCTAKEEHDYAQYGCQCVDHAGNGGFCAGHGCTAKEEHDAAQFGCGCVDHKGAGGFCPGTGCTAKEQTDCSAQGKSCSLHQCT